VGKGDTYRPVDKKRYDKNYTQIFGKKKNVRKSSKVRNK